MRIFEFASAEEQLALWKLISDNTWRAISQQAEAERRQRAEKAAQSKTRAKRGGKLGGRKSYTPPPYVTPLPPPQKPPPPQAKTEVGKQPTQQMDMGMKQQQANTANLQLPTAIPSQQIAVGVAQQQPTATTPQATPLQQPNAAQQQITQQQMRLQNQNVGVLAKNSAATKRI